MSTQNNISAGERDEVGTGPATALDFVGDALFGEA